MVNKQMKEEPAPRDRPAPVQGLVSPAGMFGLSWPVLGAAGAVLILLILGWSIAVSRGSRWRPPNRLAKPAQRASRS